MTNRIYDPNLFFEVKDNPLSLVGVFPYLGASIGAPDPNKIYMVYRPAEELSSEACINSFKLKPWINDHTMLGAQGTPAEKVGVQGVIGENVYFKDNTLFGNIVVFSTSMAGLIDQGKKELSCGYTCRYEFVEGVFNGERFDAIQRDIRGNHLALVDDGRMGSEVAVLDKADKYTFTFDTKDLKMAKETKDEGASGGGEMTLKDALEAVSQLLPVLQKLAGGGAATAETGGDDGEDDGSMPDGSAKVETQKEGGSKEDEDDDEGKDEGEDEGMDKKSKDKNDGMDKSEIKRLKSEISKLRATQDSAEKDMIKRLHERNKLAAQLSNHIGTFDSTEMTLDEVVNYGAEKLGVAKNKDALNAYLLAASKHQGASVVITGDSAVVTGGGIEQFLKEVK